MKLVLKKKPLKPTLIQGFPGFGLIGTIATEFLIEHLKAQAIGEFIYDELPPTVAVHQGKLIKPMEVYYAAKENIIILHTILAPKGIEWQVAEEIVNMAKELKVKELICLEGVMSPMGEGIYYYGGSSMSKTQAKPIQESIIMGVTASIMIKYPQTTCFFAESHSQLPDSQAAARIIEALDKYLGLHVDPKPLIAQAELFEAKLKGIIQQANKAEVEKEHKELSYLG